MKLNLNKDKAWILSVTIVCIALLIGFAMWLNKPEVRNNISKEPVNNAEDTGEANMKLELTLMAAELIVDISDDFNVILLLLRTIVIVLDNVFGIRRLTSLFNEVSFSLNHL